MFKSLFTKSATTMTSAALIVASFSVLSRVVGLLRDWILAGMFGASDALDIYFSAFRIPDTLFQLIVVGSLSASFIPLFTKYFSSEDRSRAWGLTNKILNIILLVFIAFVAVAFLFSHELSYVIAWGFDAQKQDMVAQMSKYVFGAQLFLAASMVFGSVLQGAKRFFLYALAPIFYNIGIICGAVIFVPDIGIIGLGWGVLFGAILHFGVQTLGVMSIGYTWKPLFSWKDPDMRYVIRHAIPRTLGLAIGQVNFLAMSTLATTLAAGSVAVLQFAYNLACFPVGTIGVAYAIAAFPVLCEQADKKSTSQFIASFSSVARQMLFFMIPATVFFLLLRAQIVRVALGAGKFDWEDTILTADTLAFFAMSFFAQALLFLVVRAYFAKEDTWTPFFFGMFAAIVNVIGVITLSPILGVAGLGLSFSISSIVQFILLWIFLRRKLGTLAEAEIFRSGYIIFVSAAGAAIVIQICKYVFSSLFELTTYPAVIAQGAIAGGTGLVVYLLLAWLLKSPEWHDILRGLKRRFLEKAKPAETVATTMNPS